jgi:RHS repeat-associated protein
VTTTRAGTTRLCYSYIHPVEYLSYGQSSIHNITTRPINPTTGIKEYKVQDHLGSTRIVIEETGTVLGKYDYDAWGETLWESNPMPRLSFIDKERDDESQDHNFGVRQYSPKYGGRFGSIDMMWEKYRSLSPYQYAGNNPLLYSDPTGLAFNINGPDAQRSFNELQNTTSVPMAFDNNSVTLANPNYTAQNPADQKLMDLIQDPTRTVNLNTITTNEVTDRNGNTISIAGGLYDGSSIDANGNVTAEQYVNLEHARKAELVGGGTIGQTVQHEALEAYIGAQLNPGQGYSDPAFNAAHNATLQLAPLPVLQNFPGRSGNYEYVGFMGPNGDKILLYTRDVNTGQYNNLPNARVFR